MTQFAALNTALSSLYAQQRGLDVAGQNVANANNEGYTRQRLRLEALGGASIPAMFARAQGTTGGVRVADVQRLRDMLLEARVNDERGANAAAAHRSTTLSRLEDVFAEPGDNALQAAMAEFWAGWDDVANNPADRTTRLQLVERAQSVVAGFARTAAAIGGMRDASVEELRVAVTEINAAASRVADLNEAVRAAHAAGVSANELLYQRDVLVTQLSERLGVTSRHQPDGTVDLFVAGTSLVRGTGASGLQVELSGPLVRVARVADGLPVDVAGGRAAALLDAVNVVLPRYLAGLDAVADRLAGVVNGVHQAGVDLDGAPGQAFFVGSGAAKLAVSPAVAAEPRLVAAARPGSGPLDGANAAALAELSSLAGGPDALYRTLVTDLGVEAQRADRRAEIHAAVSAQMDAARDSQAGVSVDEEMASMIAFQRAYEASARYMTSIDEVLDVLVNRTGTVGR